MTAPAQPVCQWCRHPIPGTVAWWDNQPQCPDVFRCERQRINASKEQQ